MTASRAASRPSNPAATRLLRKKRPPSSQKLTLLGERFRGAQADVNEMRSNLDQLLDRMEEAVLFFGRDDRLMMAGRGAERLLGGGPLGGHGQDPA